MKLSIYKPKHASKLISSSANEILNPNRRFYYENATKTHKYKQGRYWALEMGPTPRTTASQERFRAGAKLDPSLLNKNEKLHQNCTQGELEKELKAKLIHGLQIELQTS